MRDRSNGGDADGSEVGDDAGDRVWTANTKEDLARRETLGRLLRCLTAKTGQMRCEGASVNASQGHVVVVSHIGSPCEAPRTRNQNRSHVSLGSDETQVAAATAGRRLHLGTNVGTEVCSEGTCLLRRRVVRVRTTVSLRG